MNIDEIRAIVRNPEASAAELRQADVAADDLIKGCDAAVEALEARRQDLLLETDGGAKLKKVAEEIRGHHLQSEICVAAKAKLALLIKDADARELDADLKAKGRRTADLSKALFEQMLRWDEAQVAVGEAAANIRELTDELNALRGLLVQHGRRDLVALNPYARLQELGVTSTHIPDFRAPVPAGYQPPANNPISRPLLRLREAGLDVDPPLVQGAVKSGGMLHRAGQLLASLPGLGGATTGSDPVNYKATV